MVFVIDVDDTICDSDGYSEEYILKFFAEHNLPYKLINSVARYADAKFDWDEKTTVDWYKHNGDEMMLHFPLKNNSLQVLNKFYDAGNKIIFATARDKYWHNDPEGNTKKWLENNGFKYDKLYAECTDKTKICVDEKADVFVDDDINICLSVQKACKNTKVFLMKSRYNSTKQVPSNLTEITSFDDIMKYLK